MSEAEPPKGLISAFIEGMDTSRSIKNELLRPNEFRTRSDEMILYEASSSCHWISRMCWDEAKLRTMEMSERFFTVSLTWFSRVPVSTVMSMVSMSSDASGLVPSVISA